METLKTAIVVVLLLAVLYGVYVILNKPENAPSVAMQWQEPPLVEMDIPPLGDGDPGAPAEMARAAGETYNEVVQAHAQHADHGHADHQHADHGGHKDHRGNLDDGGEHAETGNAPAGRAVSEASPLPPASAGSAPFAGSSYADVALGQDQKQFAGSHAMETGSDASSSTSKIGPPDLLASDPAASDDRPSAPPREISSVYETTPAAQEATDSVQTADMERAEAAVSPPAESGPDSSQALDDIAAVGPGNGDRGSGYPAGPAGMVTGEADNDPPSGDPVAGTLASARQKIQQEQWYEALLALSYAYRNMGDPARTSQLLELLDPLAAKVIYSPEHLVTSPHEVRQGETLSQVAAAYDVPWQLLANINGIRNPEAVQPGTLLKVLQGPFHAEISLDNNEMTLYVGHLYAGRFPITTGTEAPPRADDYQVVDKQPGRTFYAGQGKTVAPGDPANPYGPVWIDLGKNCCISGGPASSVDPAPGSIRLSNRDANDLYGILSVGSSVTVRR